MASRDYLALQRDRVEEALARMLPPTDAEPSTLAATMRAAVFDDGERILPLLALAASEAAATAEGNPEAALAAACAAAILNAASALHAEPGDATRIAAGDALFAMAISTVCTLPGIAPARALRIADIFSKGISSADAKQGEGSLFAAAAEAGAIAGGAANDDAAALAAFGRELGMAFQIENEILAANGDAAARSASSMETRSPDKAREMAAFHTREAVANLFDIPGSLPSAALSDLAENLLKRIS